MKDLSEIKFIILSKTCERCNFYKDKVFSALRTCDERNGSDSLKSRLYYRYTNKRVFLKFVEASKALDFTG